MITVETILNVAVLCLSSVPVLIMDANDARNARAHDGSAGAEIDICYRLDRSCRYGGSADGYPSSSPIFGGDKKLSFAVSDKTDWSVNNLV